MITDVLRKQIIDYLGINMQSFSKEYKVIDEIEYDEYTQALIHYKGSEDDTIPAYLLIPNGEGAYPAIIVHHQHNRERHLGKSEVCGLAGDPLQAFGVELVKKGFVVLAPDSICFEDRRKNTKGITPDEENDFSQHYNEMCYRLLRGSSLMKKVIDDANIGFDLLKNHERVDKNRIGVLGHSYGGNTVIFQTAVNEEIRYACASGAACSFKNKMERETGIEMAEVLPGFAMKFDIQDLIKCIAPRQILLVSSTDDKYSMDAYDIEFKSRKAFEELNAGNNLEHKRYNGGHALTKEKFEDIIDWIVKVTSEI